MIKHSMQDRYDWIARYIHQNQDEVISTNNKEFTNSFVRMFGLKFILNEANIPRCQQLARDLNVMVEMGLLDRSTTVYTGKQISRVIHVGLMFSV